MSSESTPLAENLSAALDRLIAMKDEKPDIILNIVSSTA